MMDLLSWTPEYFSANEAACVAHLNTPEVRAQIPLLNCAQLHDLRDNMLVRFRGMIQDMQDPECYLESYEVRKKNDDTLVRVQNGKYRDVLVMNRDQESVDFKSPSNKYGERRSMFVISIPGFNKWAIECEQKMCPNVGEKLQDKSVVTSNAKRPHEEEMETDNVSENEHVFKKPMLPSEPSEGSSKAITPKECKHALLSAQYLLNSPISERPSKACLVKLYTDIDESTLNTVVDIVGFLSVDPALDGSTDQVEDFDDEMTEHQATHPPPSLIPRIHSISIQKLHHINPLIQNSSEAQLDNIDIWRDIHNLMTQCLFGDKVAADYLLCHLISTVYVRNDVESLGQFSLNISNIPADVLPIYTQAFYEILELLLPASHYFPMTLENMNTVQFVPKKDYTTNKLTSGLLQLAPHTHLVLDETRLQTGKLESSGVEAVQSVAHLIRTQKLKYDFKFYHLEFNSDVPTLVLSEGKSMLPTNCYLPLIPDLDATKLIEETIKAGKHYIQPKLDAMRKFLTMQRIQEFDMKSFDPAIVQDEFVRMRRQCDASSDDLHSLLVLARLIGLCRGKKMLDQDSWDHARLLEEERRNRVEMFTKRKSEM
ncbi:mini-chromosome maintenance complex-binding protein [Toxorhynchites rutilus septentrionalis]|uniref:mini-chromosome maintenance complex-binding protein n=1 Tax=Toxorhynchites rutilus septentrionalis TaxID=329112 RepID=UPI0024791A64|nr:mini-chromosome maintenance complex-binding protein [Toxorhynchites rutilus septentrionalis]XP_055619698.1 mini-chromosome maintenance complex-binding protein [Toxorhynchites rutilus septentrionalis]